MSETPLTQPPLEPVFAPPIKDDGEAKGRGNEGQMQGKKGGEAAGVAPETEAPEAKPDDPSRAPEEENHS